MAKITKEQVVEAMAAIAENKELKAKVGQLQQELEQAMSDHAITKEELDKVKSGVAELMNSAYETEEDDQDVTEMDFDDHEDPKESTEEDPQESKEEEEPESDKEDKEEK